MTKTDTFDNALKILKDASRRAANFLEAHLNHSPAARQVVMDLQAAYELVSGIEPAPRTPLNPNGLPKLTEIGGVHPLIAAEDTRWIAAIVEAARFLGYCEGWLWETQTGDESRDAWLKTRKAVIDKLYRVSGFDYTFSFEEDDTVPDPDSVRVYAGITPEPVTISNAADLACHLGVDPKGTLNVEATGEVNYRGPPAHLEERLSRRVYKDTSCGAWLKLLDPREVDDPSPMGVAIGSIVEGAAEEVGPFELLFPFAASEFDRVVKTVEHDVDVIWEDRHGEGEAEVTPSVAEQLRRQDAIELQEHRAALEAIKKLLPTLSTATNEAVQAEFLAKSSFLKLDALQRKLHMILKSVDVLDEGETPADTEAGVCGI